jgi:D-alanine-D-alanine ligase
MNILILGGGKSGEHEVSLVSAAAIARNVDPGKHRVLLCGIRKDGRWFLQSDDELTRLRGDNTAALRISGERPLSVVPGVGIWDQAGGSLLPVEVVFPVLHGSFGEDGTIQGLLELAELPYVGCTVLGSAVTMDKDLTKRLLAHAGVPVVPWVCVNATTAASVTAAVATATATGTAPVTGAATGMAGGVTGASTGLGFPLFVKPANAGSSVGITKAHDRAELGAALEEAFRWDRRVLLEQAVEAREIEAAVTGSASEGVVVHGFGEVRPTHEFYDYAAKYTDPEGAALLAPAPLEAPLQQALTDAARTAYLALECAGLARIDFFVDKVTGAWFLNEVNTMPGFTPISMFPRICETSGLSYGAQIESLIQSAVAQFRERRALATNFEHVGAVPGAKGGLV